MSDSRKQIAQKVAMVLVSYGRPMDQGLLRLWADAFEAYPVEDFSKAMNAWILKSRIPPTIADIRQILDPEPTSQDETQIVITRIIDAIQRHGWTWPHWVQRQLYQGGTWESDAKAKLGDLAFLVIQRWGGWSAIHDSFFGMDEGVFRAQLRDFVASVIRVAKAGKIDLLPGIPRPEIDRDRSEPSKIDFSGVLNGLEHKRG